MLKGETQSSILNITHSWWRDIRLVYLPTDTTPLIDKVSSGLLAKFEQYGHHVHSIPDNKTDVIITTAPFGKPMG